jgi:hypothetical protein
MIPSLYYAVYPAVRWAETRDIILGILERSCEMVRMPTQRIPVGHLDDRDSVASF